MLRELKEAHLRPTLLGFTSKPNGTTTTTTFGQGDVSTSSSSAGTSSLTIKTPSHRSNGSASEMVVIGSPSREIPTDGLYVDTAGGAVGPSTVALRNVNSAGSAVNNSTLYGLVCVWASPSTDICSPYQHVMGTSRAPRLMGFRVNSGGSISVGSMLATGTNPSTGVNTLTFSRAYGHAPTAVACAIATTQKTTSISSISASAVSIHSMSSAPAAENNASYVLVYGFDSLEQQGGRRHSPVLVPSRKPRFIAGEVIISTNTIAIGTGEFTYAKNGTGDVSLTWVTPFKREPIVVVTGQGCRAQLHSNASTTTCRVLTFDAGGAAVDGEFFLMVLGSDDVVEY